MRIAIIDGQINSDAVTAECTRYQVSNGNVQETTKNCNKMSHGTIVSQIIGLFAKFDEIIILEILYEEEIGNIQNLIAALEWCTQENVNLINLSIGTTEKEDFEPLKKICMQLKKQGKLLIAAEHNQGLQAAPALFDGVISVKKMRMKHFMIYNKRKNQILISGEKWLRLKDGSYTKSVNCNSYACACATSVLSRKGKRIINDRNQKCYKIIWTK